MASIISKPTDFFLTGNAQKIKVSSIEAVDVIIKINDKEIARNRSFPIDSIVEIDVGRIADNAISCTIAQSSEKTICDQLSVTVDALEPMTFFVIKGGVAVDSLSTETFLLSNFLTWQPQIIKSQITSPRWLRYVSTSNLTIKACIYYQDQGSTTTSMANFDVESLTRGEVYTYNIKYNDLINKIPNTAILGGVDIWVENAAGNKVTYVQRITYIKSAKPHIDVFMYLNSLGGFDTIELDGKKTSLQTSVIKIVCNKEVSNNYDSENLRSYKKSTGNLTSAELLQCREFVVSSLKACIYNGSIVNIVVTENVKNENEQYELSAFEFTYKISKNEKYYNLPKTAVLEDIVFELDDRYFSLAPRLFQLPLADASEGLLIPVQSANEEQWRILSLSVFIKSLIPTEGTYHPFGGRNFMPIVANTVTSENVIANNISSSNFDQSGFSGHGMGLWIDPEGLSHAELDHLTIRQGLEVYELIINQVSFITNVTIFSNGGCEITNIEDNSTFWRCFYENKNNTKYSGLKIDDQVRCQRYDAENTNIIKYYWRLVVGVGSNYVDISKSNSDVDSQDPEIGDNIVQFGNISDRRRQSAKVIDVGNMKEVWYAKIDSYNLTNKNYIGQGVDVNTGNSFDYGYGSSYRGSRARKSYIEYNAIDENFDIKSKLTITSGSSGLGNLEEWDDAARDIEEAKAAGIAAEREAINAQEQIANTINPELIRLQAEIDGQINSWFYNYSPTMENYPASSWQTTEQKRAAVGDTFTNVEQAPAADAGKSWRWVEAPTDTFYWTPISDSDAVLALQKAAAAQSSADGKSTIYLNTPSSYKYGDQWTCQIKGDANEGDILFATQDSNIFVRSHWLKRDKYTDDTAVKNLTIGDVNLCNNSYPTTPFEGSATKYNILTDASHGNYIKKDHTYTITAELMVDNDFPQMTRYGLGFWTSGAQALLPRFSPTQWTVVQLTFKATADGYLNAFHYPNGSSGRSYVKWVKLVEGSKSSVTWSPSVEDVNKDIAAAQTTADAATTKLTDWASDAKISPTEKGSLKLQQQDIRTEYADVVASATKYGVATVNYKTAFDAANAALTKYTAATPESIAVGPDYATITAYYTARQTVLGLTATAAKAYSEKLVADIEVGGVNLLTNTKEYLFPIATTRNHFYTMSPTQPILQDVTYVFTSDVEVLAGEPNAITVRFFNDSLTTKGSEATAVITNGKIKCLISVKDAENATKLLIYNGVANLTTGNQVRLTKFKLERGNKPTDWSPAPEDVDKEIADAKKAGTDANAAVGSLNTYMDGAFKDGVISESEAKAIATYIRQVEETELGINNTYSSVYNNPLLSGLTKTNLATAKTNVSGAITNLKGSINTAIADGKTTIVEKADVDAKFVAFNSTYGIYITRIEDATKFIQDAIKAQADKGVADANAALLAANKAQADANASIADYNAKFAVIQAQVDGEVSNWYYAYSPTLTNAPANTWLTNTERDRHIGDTFLNTQPYVTNATTPDAGKAWRYVRNGSIYSWTPISDSDAVKALQEASKAQSTADGKSTTYIIKPTKYAYGDMWVLESDDVHSPNKQGEVLFTNTTSATYLAAHWVSKVRYTDDTAVNNLQISGTNQLQNARYNNLSDARWTENNWSGAMSLVSDPKFGKVVQWKRIGGAGEFQNHHPLYTNFYNCDVVYSVIAKEIGTEGSWSFGDWGSGTFNYLSNHSQRIDLGDGWHQYWRAFRCSSLISGTPFGINNVIGTWQFYGASVTRGNRPTDWSPSVDSYTYLSDAIKQGDTTIEGGLVLSNIMAVKNSTGAITAGMNGQGNGAPFIFAQPTMPNDWNSSQFKVNSNGEGKWGVMNVAADNISITDTSSNMATIINNKRINTLASMISSTALATPAFVKSSATYSSTFNNTAFTVSQSKPFVVTITILSTITIRPQVGALETDIRHSVYYNGSVIYTRFVRGINGTTTETKTITINGNSAGTYAFSVEHEIYGTGTSTISSSGTPTASYVLQQNLIASTGIATMRSATQYSYCGYDTSGNFTDEVRNGNIGIRAALNSIQMTWNGGGSWYTISRDVNGYLKAN